MAEDHEKDETLDAQEEEQDDLENLDFEEEEEKDSTKSDEEEEDSEDDDKPLTKKDLKLFQKNVDNTINSRFAEKRRDFKRDPSKTYQPDQKNKGGADKPKPWEGPINEMRQAEAKRQFGYENSLSPREVDLVFKYEPKPTRATLKDPFIQGGLERIRQQKNASKNIPRGSSAQTIRINGKSWDEMKPEEKQANMLERRKAILEGKRNRS